MTRLWILAALAVCGCVSRAPPPGHRDAARPPPLPEQTLENALAMQRAGQAVVEEAYVQNGVIVTPSRNWMFGQTQSYANAPLRQFDQRDWLAYATAQYGGVMTGDVAERAGTGRSQEERDAIQRIELIGKFKKGGAQPAGSLVARGGPRGPVERPADGFFSPEGVLLSLDGLNPNDLRELPVGIPPAGLRLVVPTFELGQHALKLTDTKVLGEAGQQLAGYMGLVHVTGFTDPSGTEIFNVGLADRRADAVASVLGANGLALTRVITIGKPQCCYLNDNASATKRAMNRRAEIRLGGAFVRASARSDQAVAEAIGRVFKTTGGDENFPIRVYGVAPNAEVAVALGTSLAKLLSSPNVGHQNVLIGDPVLGNSEQVVVELIPAIRQ